MSAEFLVAAVAFLALFASWAVLPIRARHK